MKFSWILLTWLGRIATSLIICTYFNPDEYWQALEVAHEMSFGYGHKTWEWLPHVKLRGYTHPLLFAIPYKLLQILHIDTPVLVRITPRLLQASFAALGDVATYHLTQNWFGSHSAKYALFSQWICWFYLYCIPRTFSNCLETIFTTIALCYWPFPSINNTKSSNLPFSLLFAALSIILRPTAVILWLILGLYLFSISSHRFSLIFYNVIPIGIVVVFLSCLLDRFFYGSWTFVAWNFVRFNTLEGGAEMYGVHPFHWYFSQGFLTMLTTLTPFFFLGIYLSKRYLLSFLVLCLLLFYSISTHKEYRFILTTLPLAFVYCGFSLSWIAKRYETRTKSSIYRYFPALLIGLVLTNLPVALYLGTVHQRAPVHILQHISQQIVAPLPVEQQYQLKIHVLGACHSTPHLSQLHVELELRWLDCSPLLDRKTGQLTETREFSEGDLFEKQPLEIVTALYSSQISTSLASLGKSARRQYPRLSHRKWNLPHYLIIFDQYESLLAPFLTDIQAKVIYRTFHSHFEESSTVALYRIEQDK